MLVGMALGVIVLATPALQADTTFAVDPGLRLELRNRSGDITIRTWDRNEVRVETDRSRRSPIVIERTSGAVRIGTTAWPRDDDDTDLWLTVPASMSLDLSGSESDVTVDGSKGEISVDLSEGDVSIRGGSGRVSVRTNDGAVTVEDADGMVRLFSMDGDIIVEHASGDIEVETTDGTIELRDVVAATVRATTVDGDIWFDGELALRGEYSLETHDGDITVYVSEDSDARVRVAVYDGDFSSDFSITFPSWPRGRRAEFTLGGGSAGLQLETFDGDIQLLRRRR